MEFELSAYFLLSFIKEEGGLPVEADGFVGHLLQDCLLKPTFLFLNGEACPKDLQLQVETQRPFWQKNSGHAAGHPPIPMGEFLEVFQGERTKREEGREIPVVSDQVFKVRVTDPVEESEPVIESGEGVELEYPLIQTFGASEGDYSSGWEENPGELWG